MFYRLFYTSAKAFFLTLFLLFAVCPIEGQETLQTSTTSEVFEDSNPLLPTAVSVLTPEEAKKANNDALKDYNGKIFKQKIKRFLAYMAELLVGVLLIAYIIYLGKKRKLKSSLLKVYSSPFGRMFYCTRFCNWDYWGIVFVFAITFFFSMLTGGKATANGYKRAWYEKAAVPVALSIYNIGDTKNLVVEPDSKLDNFLKKGPQGDLESFTITNEEAVPLKYTGKSFFYDSNGIAWMMAFWWKLIGYPDLSTLYILYSLFYGLIAVAAYCALRQATGLVPSVILALLLSAYPSMMYQVLYGFRDGARSLFCFIAIAILLYMLKGGFRWKGTIVSSIFLFLICSLSKYFRQDFIVLIPFIIIAAFFFHGKILANYRKKIVIVVSVVAGLTISFILPNQNDIYNMGHVLYIGMADHPYMDNLHFSADNYSKGIAYSDVYGFMAISGKAYREKDEVNISLYSKEYDRECTKEILSLFAMYPYDFFRLAFSCSIQSLNLGSRLAKRNIRWIVEAPGHRWFQDLSSGLYKSVPSWLYFALLLGAFFLFLGGKFYQNMFVCLAFMPMCGVYMLQFEIRHYFYLLIVSLLIAGFVFNRLIRIPFILLRNWKTVWRLCVHRKKAFMIHCAVFTCLIVLVFGVLFVSHGIQTGQVKKEVKSLNAAKTEEIQFEKKIVESKFQRGYSNGVPVVDSIVATDALFPSLYNDVLDQSNPKQLCFNEFLKIKFKVVDADTNEKIRVFAKYENTNDFDCLPKPANNGEIINLTWTCPVYLTFAIGKETGTLYIPVYFSRSNSGNYAQDVFNDHPRKFSPLIGIEFLAGGKMIEIESLERIIETGNIRTLSAFLVPDQTNEMQYAGTIDWNRVFWAKK